jgi:hypothetical protein
VIDSSADELERLANTYPTWGLEASAGHVRVGSVDQLNAPEPLGTVTLVPADWNPGPGRLLERRHVRESASEFDVEFVQYDGFTGLRHGGGGNRMAWTAERIPRRFVVTEASDDARRWVHARYVLRHLNAAHLIASQSREPLHAVIGWLPGDPAGGGLLIHGPSGSGKTYLWQLLADAGVVAGMPEDDCALVGPDWDALCLLPRRDEVVESTRVAIRAIVALDGDDTPARLDGRAFLDLAGATWVSWPATWLPGGDLRPIPSRLPPPGVPILRVGARRATSRTVPAVAALLDG